MHRSRWFAVFLAFCLAQAGAVLAADAEPAEFSVGVAEVDITPEYPIRLNGFLGRTKESAGVRQQIWAKSLAIGTNDDDVVVIITTDALGIPDDLAERVSQRLKQSHALPRERLVITATHTHSAPLVRNCANLIFGQPIPEDQWDRIEKYTAELEAKLVKVAAAALGNRQASRLSWGVGKVKFAVNRRTKNGPVDHDLPVLAVHDRQGKLRAVFTTYATHCVNLSDDLINGDWAGYAMEHIQRLNPGCIAMMSVGCGADSNPVENVVVDRVEIPDRHGIEIAQEVQRLLTDGMTPLTRSPAAKFRRITLPLAPLPARDHWEELAKQQTPTGYHARVQVARLDKGGKLMDSISYPIQSISFGDELAMVFLPGEVVVDYALRLKREFQGSRLWMNAYANACPGYVPSERILKEGGYEGGQAMIYYDIPGPYAPGLEQKIVAEVHAQLPETLLSHVDVHRTQGLPPKSPAESLAAIRVKPGFRVELVAAEPLIQSPVAINFGPDGCLWVAEMWDYPAGANGQYEPGGRIRRVHDDDGDGKYDRSEIFLDGIPFPTGVTVWRDGLLICAAPDILYAEDTDADGRADVVKKLFSGFATHNYQARVNSLEYGLDGWVYVSCGLFGGTITSHLASTAIPLGGRDFRINPDTGELQPVTGTTQQGRVRNDWGDWFGCNNGSMLLHYPLDDHYLRRNPFSSPPGTVVGIAAEPDAGRLFSISEQVLFKLSGPPNRPTAACGVGIYRDDLLGRDYSGNSFTCEPVNNLVHRQILSRQGTTFTSRRADDELDREFLASTDPWFRPVQARTGPDGGLWVVDMYRYVIEHPIWIPPETLAELDTRAGASMGRIYRVVPAESPPRVSPRLDQMLTKELSQALDTPNGSRRDLIHQMLLWRKDAAAVSGLRRLSEKSSRPEVRVQALCAWSGLEQPSEAALLKVMEDSHPGVRRHAVRLAERLLNDSPEVAAAVIRLAGDDDPTVRLQVAYSLGALEGAAAAAPLAALLLSDPEDVYQRAAVESSFTSRNIIAVLDALQRHAKDSPSPLLDQVYSQAAALAEARAAESLLKKLAQQLTNAPNPQAFYRLAKFIEAWGHRKRTDFDPQSPALQTAWQPAFARALDVAQDAAAELPIRLAAVQLLGQGPILSASHAESLVALLTPQTPTELQAAAADALSRHNEESIPELMIADWATHAPKLRREIIAALLSRSAWAKSLLLAVQQKTLTVADFDLSQQQALLNHADKSIRVAAEKSFQTQSAGARQDVVDRYVAELKDDGDPALGRQLYQKHCAVCHKIQDAGHAVGPDIAPYSGKPAQALLIAMLSPNQAIDPRYQSYVASLDGGRTVSGLIAEETSTGFTLLAAEGKRQTVLRSEIEELRNTGKSLMPEGFEQNLTTEDVSNLWAYVRTWRLPPKSLPGNQPALVEIKDERGVSLRASRAEIFGQDITFEIPFQNIGYWHGTGDFIRWRIKSPRLLQFDVWSEWSCAPEAAGNVCRLEGADPILVSRVPSTGGWDRFQFVRLGTIRVREGESEIVIRPDESLRGALADLRAVHLVAPGTVPEAAGKVERAATKELPNDPKEIARILLDDQRPQAEREELLAKSLDHAAEIITAMAAGLPTEAGSAEEYRRIPWIWRVAIAVGKTKQPEPMRDILEVSLPADDQRLEHWQAVVIGGGIINGISLTGEFPLPVMAEILGNDRKLGRRWQRALNLSVTMADDEKVPHGTRYDALRMVALLGWKRSSEQLQRYLKPGVNDELQMGAISGLADVPDEGATAALLSGIGRYSDHNRALALDALLRTDERCQSLLKAVTGKKITATQLGPERLEKLKAHPTSAIRKEAKAVLPE